MNSSSKWSGKFHPVGWYSRSDNVSRIWSIQSCSIWANAEQFCCLSSANRSKTNWTITRRWVDRVLHSIRLCYHQKQPRMCMYYHFTQLSEHVCVVCVCVSARPLLCVCCLDLPPPSVPIVSAPSMNQSPAFILIASPASSSQAYPDAQQCS